jgi:hypothetical protein
MNETAFVLPRAIRASDGGFRHEKHEGYIYPVVSCLPSCTDLGTKSSTELGLHPLNFVLRGGSYFHISLARERASSGAA